MACTLTLRGDGAGPAAGSKHRSSLSRSRPSGLRTPESSAHSSYVRTSSKYSVRLLKSDFHVVYMKAQNLVSLGGFHPRVRCWPSSPPCPARP